MIYIKVLCPKSTTIFFQNIFSVHSYKTRFADNQNYFIQRVSKNSGREVFFEGLRYGQK